MNEITSPAIVIDPSICKKNIDRMKNKADHHGLELRPHFKTHRSPHVGQWFREAGIDAITVSSLSMAEYFAEQGWKDITIAFPLNIREAEGISKLADRIALNILIDDPAQIEGLNNGPDRPMGAFIKIDTSYGRAGIKWDDEAGIRMLHEQITQHPKLRFKGILTHNGNTYSARGKDEVESMHRPSAERLRVSSSLLPANSRGIISMGDTPSASLSEHFEGISEIRPGNFVYYDLMQWQIGSCGLEDIGVAVFCPVISKYPSRNEVLVHTGSIHLSKEHIDLEGTGAVYGLVVKPQLTETGRAVPGNGKAWTFFDDPSYLTRLSQEHGIIRASDELMREVEPGHLLGILPVHSCLLSNLPLKIVD